MITGKKRSDVALQLRQRLDALETDFPRCHRNLFRVGAAEAIVNGSL